jgi:hypothetical protein
LDNPRADQLDRCLRKTGGKARKAESRDPGEEDALAPKPVPKAARND